jgi:hypothetical protein
MIFALETKVPELGVESRPARLIFRDDALAFQIPSAL